MSEKLYKQMQDENTALESALNEQTATDVQRMTYNDQGLNAVLRVNWWLFVLYCILAICLVIFFFHKKTFSLVYLFVITLALMLYPFIIDFMELSLYRFVSYLFSIVTGVVYQ